MLLFEQDNHLNYCLQDNLEERKKSYNQKTTFCFAPRTKYVTTTVRRLASCNLQKYLKAIILWRTRENQTQLPWLLSRSPFTAAGKDCSAWFPKGTGEKSREQPGRMCAYIRSKLICNHRTPAPIPPWAEQGQKGMWKYTMESSSPSSGQGYLGWPHSHSTMLLVTTEQKGGSNSHHPTLMKPRFTHSTYFHNTVHF